MYGILVISLKLIFKMEISLLDTVDFWYLLISLKATIPGLYQRGFLIPPVGVAPKCNNFQDRCFQGCFPPSTGGLLDAGLGVGLPSWTSLPIAIFSLFYVGVSGGLLCSCHYTGL